MPFPFSLLPLSIVVCLTQRKRPHPFNILIEVFIARSGLTRHALCYNDFPQTPPEGSQVSNASPIGAHDPLVRILYRLFPHLFVAHASA